MSIVTKSTITTMAIYVNESAAGPRNAILAPWRLMARRAFHSRAAERGSVGLAALR